MKPNIRTIPALIALALLLTSITAAVTLLPGCAQVQPGGAYNGDSLLYQSEQSIVTGKQILDTFVGWEYRNRRLLDGTPEITQAANQIRRNAKQWFTNANNLHDAYAANPTPGNKAVLESAIRVINQAVQEALGYLQKFGPNK